MPDARIEEDGTWRFGASTSDPYSAVWSSVSLFSRLELSGRYIGINRVPAFSEAPELGDYRDKAFDGKATLFRESAFIPEIAIGAQDYVGTRLFAARYAVATKRVGDFDVSVGYGQARIDGLFGGVRYRPAAWGGWSAVVEYDANDYKNDYRADLSHANRRSGGRTYALEYTSGWWGAQLSYQDGNVGGNVYVAVPLMKREFVPKIDEPHPLAVDGDRVSIDAWRNDKRYAIALARALHEQGYSDVHFRLKGNVLELALTHDRISLIGRAVGRAARTALKFGPKEMTALRITYTVNDLPLLTYEFNDPALLERYFAGQTEPSALEAQTTITFASVDLAQALRYERLLALDSADDEGNLQLVPDDKYFFWTPPRGSPLSDFGLSPFNVRLFFNDPGQPIRYDTFAAATYNRRLAPGLFLDGSARLTLFENVSDIRQPSTSLLPHVRSDIGDYRREGQDLRLNSLLLNKYSLWSERWYSRFSLGYYEEMYAGGGGQLLYLPSQGNWAADLAVDALRQRAPGEAFGVRDYSVVTAISSLHYRFPSYGVTATARVGRFLAKDEGVRMELKRRFRSGVELGGWYTWTNEKDITNPGTPDHPYYDKGIFVSIPLSSMLTKDTRESANMALADYTRDVGQMVVSPGDLYRMVEQSLRFDNSEYGPLTDFVR